MDESQVDAVYELVLRTFTELGVSNPRCISRSFLLRDSYYAGQVWRCEGFQAVWLLGRETVEFRDSASNPVKSASLVAEITRKAA